MCKGINKILMDTVKQYSVKVMIKITKQMRSDINILPKRKIIRFNKDVLRSIEREEISDFVAVAMSKIYEDKDSIYIKDFHDVRC